jgi:hypothetical protein
LSLLPLFILCFCKQISTDKTATKPFRAPAVSVGGLSTGHYDKKPASHRNLSSSDDDVEPTPVTAVDDWGPEAGAGGYGSPSECSELPAAPRTGTKSTSRVTSATAGATATKGAVSDGPGAHGATRDGGVTKDRPFASPTTVRTLFEPPGNTVDAGSDEPVPESMSAKPHRRIGPKLSARGAVNLKGVRVKPQV